MKIFNIYAYVGGNPVNFVDPLGLDPLCAGGGQSIVCTDGQRPPPEGTPLNGPLSPVGAAATAAEAGALICPPLRTGKAAKGVVDILKPYQRPANATTRAQRELVQGQPCVTCGNTAPRQVADHKKPLVEEYYETGTIDIQRMRSPDAVQPQCPTCSAAQGGAMRQYSNQMREKLGL